MHCSHPASRSCCIVRENFDSRPVPTPHSIRYHAIVGGDGREAQCCTGEHQRSKVQTGTDRPMNIHDWFLATLGRRRCSTTLDCRWDVLLTLSTLTLLRNFRLSFCLTVCYLVYCYSGSLRGQALTTSSARRALWQTYHSASAKKVAHQHHHSALSAATGCVAATIDPMDARVIALWVYGDLFAIQDKSSCGTSAEVSSALHRSSWRVIF